MLSNGSMSARAPGGHYMDPSIASQAYRDCLLDLSDDMSELDMLSLRRDQQLEHAKEFDSILPEPHGSRLKARGMSARAAQGGKDISMRPPWKQPCKCAPHPWRPLQWDHVSQNQLKAFETGLRGSDDCIQAGRQQTNQSCRDACQGQQPSAAQPKLHAYRQMHSQPAGQGQPAPGVPHAIAAVKNHTSRQQQMQQLQQQLSVSPDRHVSNAKSVSWLGQPPGYLKRSHASQAGIRQPDCPPTGSCQHTSAVNAPDRPASAVHMAGRSSVRQHRAGKASSCRAGAGFDSRSHCKGSQGLSTTGADKPSKTRSTAKSESVSTAQHRCGQSRGQPAGRGQDCQQRVLPMRSASASPTVMGNWIRWEAPENADEAESGLFARKGQVGTAAAASSCSPERPMLQSCNSQHAASPTNAATTQQQPTNRRHTLPCSGYSAHMKAASHPCSPAVTSPVQQNKQPAPVQQSPDQMPSSEPTSSFGRGCSGAGRDSRAPDMRYCLSSPEPAVGAGMWEEQTTRSWLREAGLGVTPADESAPLLDNPLRNGLLLCDLAGALEGRIVWGMNRTPRNLARARSNIMAALGHLGMLTAQTCPRGLVHEVEHVLQGRQASIWGLLNHLRLTHPSAVLLGKQIIGQQAVDRTFASDAEACKPDRCSGAVAAAINDMDDGNATVSPHMVNVGPQGSIRCTSPVQRSPRAEQHNKRQSGSAPCPYHDHETITVSLVPESGLYNPPERSVSPQRSQRGQSPVKQRDGNSCSSRGSDAYVRVVAVGPAVGKHSHGSGQCLDQQEPRQQRAAALQRCPEPAAASTASRKHALAQLRMARRKQQQVTPADVEQQVADRMSARNKQGAGSEWSSRKAQKEQHSGLSELDLVAWARSKGLTELSPGMLLEESFADGRLLCQLVSLLERRTISGVEWRAPSIAASRHNVAKAMSELKKRPSMSLQHLWQVTEMVKAEPGFVQTLLNDMIAAYK